MGIDERSEGDPNPSFDGPTIAQRVTMIERFLALSIQTGRFEGEAGDAPGGPALRNEFRVLRYRFQPDRIAPLVPEHSLSPDCWCNPTVEKVPPADLADDDGCPND